MASCSGLMSEERFMCSICLDVFIDPVSIQCGHNFCKACITKYWDCNARCQCPMCKKSFDKRPKLWVNTFISEMAAQVRNAVSVKAASSSEGQPTKHEVSCDVCTGTKLSALKSCLGCQASYCQTHLEPHQRIAGLRKHKLIDPVKNLEDRMCKKHERPLELFCRTDQTCVCQFCTEGDHRAHDTVPLEQESKRRKIEMKTTTGGEVQRMIQERLEKVQEIKLSIETSQRDAEREISDSVETFTALVRSIEKGQAVLIQVIKENQRATVKQAEGFIRELEQEIADLKKRSADLELLSQSEDDLHLLQRFPSLSAPPPTKDWSEVCVHSKLKIDTVRRYVSHLADKLSTAMEKLPEVKLKRIQRLYAVDVTLDPDTAHPDLILSEDEKQVSDSDTTKNLPDNPQRFYECVCVLGRQSFSSGRFYYEVQVEGKTEWDVGVARASINRKGEGGLTPEDGYWTMILRNGEEYGIPTEPPVLLSLKAKLQKVGVYVDYGEGEVSFFDVGARSLIYSFTGCTFTEKLHPYFSPSLNYDGENSAPLIITPVNLES